MVIYLDGKYCTFTLYMYIVLPDNEIPESTRFIKYYCSWDKKNC